MTREDEITNDEFWINDDQLPVIETEVETLDPEYREGETTHEHQMRVGKYVMKKWSRVLEYLAKH